MYFFVRVQALVTIIFGVLLMLLGLGLVIAGFVQNAVLVELVNTYYLAGSSVRMVDARFYASVIGLAIFLLGLAVAAAGQLLLVFADMASNTRETNQLLIRMRKPDQNPVVYSTLQPVVVQPAQTGPMEFKFTGIQPVEVPPTSAPPVPQGS